MNCPSKVRIHRFRDTVAISFIGIDAETIYLSESDAVALVECCSKVSAEISRKPFSESTVGSMSFQCAPDPLPTPKKGALMAYTGPVRDLQNKQVKFKRETPRSGWYVCEHDGKDYKFSPVFLEEVK